MKFEIEILYAQIPWSTRSLFFPFFRQKVSTHLFHVTQSKEKERYTVQTIEITRRTDPIPLEIKPSGSKHDEILKQNATFSITIWSKHGRQPLLSSTQKYPIISHLQFETIGTHGVQRQLHSIGNVTCFPWPPFICQPLCVHEHTTPRMIRQPENEKEKKMKSIFPSVHILYSNVHAYLRTPVQRE